MSAAQPTVLVVDDREENRYTLCHTLKRNGFRTVEAASGLQALELSKDLPDLVLLDIRLPDMLGYEVCRRIKANPQTCHIPVLQVSVALQSAESKLYALESGANAYLVHPVDPLVLVGTVRSLLRVQSEAQRARTIAQGWSASFDALSEGVAIIQAETVERCNRTMTQLLDLPYGQIEGQLFPEVLHRHFGIEETMPTTAVRHVQAGSRFYRLSTAPLPPDEHITGCIFIVADITPQKRAEEALLLNERLAATGRMAHIIAHEINNPLEAITNLVYLLQHADTEPEQAQEWLTIVADEVNRVSQISRQILSFHRETRSPVPINITELVQDVLALSTRAATERQVTVKVEVEPELRVSGLPARLRQVFSNILRNAIEASPTHGILRVRVSRSTLRTHEKMTPAVRVSVADEGTGIPPALRKRIFDAFFTTKEEKGSGVGLWLTATIVEEHGGRMQVRSCTTPGTSGTCMSVLLPAQDSPQRITGIVT